MPYKVLIVEDHPIVSQGILFLINQLDDISCCIFENFSSIATDILESEANLYIIDLSLPGINGFQLVESLYTKFPSCHILVYTMHDEPWIIEKLSMFNVQGAVLKSDPIEEITKAVKSIRNGKRYFSSSFSTLMTESHKHSSNMIVYNPELSKREKEVLHYIIVGFNTTEIADKLFLSTNTIHTYRKRLMSKLNAKNMAELVYKGKDFF